MIIDAREKFAQRFINHMKNEMATSQEVLKRLMAMPVPFRQMIQAESKRADQ